MVCGWRQDAPGLAARAGCPRWFANRLISWATGVQLHDYGCSLKAIRARWCRASALRRDAPLHPRRRVLDGRVAWRRWRSTTGARTRGRSKYGIGRTLRVLLDLFTVKFLLAYGTRPAHLFGLWGLLAGGLGIAHPRLPDLREASSGTRRSAAGRCCCSARCSSSPGCILVSFGLLAELLVRIYHESQGKPIYVVKDGPAPPRASPSRC